MIKESLCKGGKEEGVLPKNGEKEKREDRILRCMAAVEKGIAQLTRPGGNMDREKREELEAGFPAWSEDEANWVKKKSRNISLITSRKGKVGDGA